MLKVDSHQHFWVFDPLRDSWITEDLVNIRRDFLPDDLKPILDRNNVSACVAVQADQSEEETRFLLDLAERNNFISGVVGWTDLRSVELIKRLEHYQAYPKLKGFRHIVQAEDEGFMLSADFLKGISALKDFDLTYDILVRSSQIKEAVKLVELHPDQRFVLDHIGKPPIKSGSIRTWETDIRQLALHENVLCKLSGMVTEADLGTWTPADVYPYMDIVMNAFGAKRIMFGSDWPVCTLAAEYKEVCGLVSAFLDQMGGFERELIWSRNAVEFYKLDIN